ncbi:MAG: hypothetical protein L6435_14120 [Anaerolineae bacterium]|nr:hypothetical protein [Anaerolineae bacterium]
MMRVRATLNREYVRVGRAVLGAALMLLLVLSQVASVLAMPQPGHYFYGTVTCEAEPLDEGTPITAKVGGLEFHTTVDALGRYGYSPNYFKIPADDPWTPEKEGAAPGELIEFYVDGLMAKLYDVEAEQWLYRYPFESGGTTCLDLEVLPQSRRLFLPLLVNEADGAVLATGFDLHSPVVGLSTTREDEVPFSAAGVKRGDKWAFVVM